MIFGRPLFRVAQPFLAPLSGNARRSLTLNGRAMFSRWSANEAKADAAALVLAKFFESSSVGGRATSLLV
jgi:hypothetical protein